MLDAILDAKTGKMSDTYRKRSIISLTTKSSQLTSDYIAIMRDVATIWKKQISYLVGIDITQRNTSIVITELVREATLP